MRLIHKGLLSLCGHLLLPCLALAHFNMLLPENASAKKGQAVTVLYQWGHPFEHQLFDAPHPQDVFVLTPNGLKTSLTKELRQKTANLHDGKKGLTYILSFTPEQRGDYIFSLQTPPIWMAEEQEFFQDTVKVVLHVQAQKGWDVSCGQSFEVAPLTRPYGLQAGTAFQAQILEQGKPLAGCLVEIERYNPQPPPELLPDELITRTARTDPGGSFVATLSEPGWWSLTAQKVEGEAKYQEKNYPLRRRTTLWVYVEGRTPQPK